MTEREKMISGKLYNSTLDGLPEERTATKNLIWKFNQLPPTEIEEQQKLLRQIIGKVGKGFWIEQPFRCDYGSNIEIGDNFYSNYNLVILDCGKVTIGNNVMIAPNVGIYAAGHPLDAQLRNSLEEYGMPITIGNDVWIGANVVLNPGVTIGNGTVIGSGSVVTKDIPDNVLAAGNPCRVIRAITEEDKKYYFKKLPVEE